jgi:hypothetical protein
MRMQGLLMPCISNGDDLSLASELLKEREILRKRMACVLIRVGLRDGGSGRNGSKQSKGQDRGTNEVSHDDHLILLIVRVG